MSHSNAVMQLEKKKKKRRPTQNHFKIIVLDTTVTQMNPNRYWPPYKLYREKLIRHANDA